MKNDTDILKRFIASLPQDSDLRKVFTDNFVTWFDQASLPGNKNLDILGQRDRLVNVTNEFAHEFNRVCQENDQLSDANTKLQEELQDHKLGMDRNQNEYKNLEREYDILLGRHEELETAFKTAFGNVEFPTMLRIMAYPPNHMHSHHPNTLNAIKNAVKRTPEEESELLKKMSEDLHKMTIAATEAIMQEKSAAPHPLGFSEGASCLCHLASIVQCESMKHLIQEIVKEKVKEELDRIHTQTESDLDHPF